MGVLYVACGGGGCGWDSEGCHGCPGLGAYAGYGGMADKR